MKRFLVFSFLTVLLISTNASALTSSFSDDCATLSLSGPVAAPGYLYYIEASGKNNISSQHTAWFYVNGNPVPYDYSFSVTSPSLSFTKPLAFTGPHSFKLVIQCGPYAHGWELRSVGLTVPHKDPKEMAESICTLIRGLPGTAFKGNPDQRMNAFCEKIAEIIQLIQSAEASTNVAVKNRFYREAIDKLLNDVGAKMDGYHGGHEKDDWIIDKGAQDLIYPKVQELAGVLISLLQ